MIYHHQTCPSIPIQIKSLPPRAGMAWKWRNLDSLPCMIFGKSGHGLHRSYCTSLKFLLRECSCFVLSRPIPWGVWRVVGDSWQTVVNCTTKWNFDVSHIVCDRDGHICKLYSCFCLKEWIYLFAHMLCSDFSFHQPSIRCRFDIQFSSLVCPADFPIQTKTTWSDHARVQSFLPERKYRSFGALNIEKMSAQWASTISYSFLRHVSAIQPQRFWLCLLNSSFINSSFKRFLWFGSCVFFILLHSRITFNTGCSFCWQPFERGHGKAERLLVCDFFDYVFILMHCKKLSPLAIDPFNWANCWAAGL